MRTLLGPTLFLAIISAPAGAQERPLPAVDFAAGWVGFPDDGLMVSEGLLGAAARFYLSPRVGIGPEVLYIQGSDHSHFILTGNVTLDLRRPAGDQPRVAPFLTIGGGLYQTRESFLIGPYTSREGAFTAGGGVRGRVSDRVTVGVDARMGWEAHVRLNGVVGVRLGR